MYAHEWWPVWVRHREWLEEVCRGSMRPCVRTQHVFVPSSSGYARSTRSRSLPPSPLTHPNTGPLSAYLRARLLPSGYTAFPDRACTASMPPSWAPISDKGRGCSGSHSGLRTLQPAGREIGTVRRCRAMWEESVHCSQMLKLEVWMQGQREREEERKKRTLTRQPQRRDAPVRCLQSLI